MTRTNVLRSIYSTKNASYTWIHHNNGSPVAPRHAASFTTQTSVQRGSFVNALQRANSRTAGSQLRGAQIFVFPPCRYNSTLSSGSVLDPSNAPQSINPTKSKSLQNKTEKSNSTGSAQPADGTEANSQPNQERCHVPPRTSEQDRELPTQIVSQRHINEYLKTLYSRGWSIDYRRKKDEAGQRYPVTSLQIYFKYLSWEAFFALGKMVRGLQKSENHHGEWKLRGLGNALDFKSLRLLNLKLPHYVAFLIRTHHAKSHEIFPYKGVIEGVTIRDIRFAILLSDLIDKHNAETRELRLKIRIDDPPDDPPPRPVTLLTLLRDPTDVPKPLVRRKRGLHSTKNVVQEFYIENPGFKELEKIGSSSEKPGKSEP